MVHTNTVMFLPEGASSSRPPGFDGNHYYYWKGQMRLFLESQDTDIWEIIEDGPFTPMSTNADGTEVVKPKSAWTIDEKHKVLLNSKSKFFLTCALGRSEYDKVAGCETAKQIWDTLKTAHEGTDQVKEAKINILVHKYELFKMIEDESIDEMISRFTVIINDLKSLGKEFTNQENVRKVLRSLPKVWRPKVTAIQEAKDLSVLRMDELLGSLKVHEQEIMEEIQPKKGKMIALKASHKATRNTSQSSKAAAFKSTEEQSEEGEESEGAETENEDELALISRRIQRMLRNRNGKKFPPRREFQKGETSKTQSTCFECNKPGHFKADCPLLKKPFRKYPQKKKAMLATWDDSDESSSEQEHEAANLCLMAESDNEVTNSELTHCTYCAENQNAFDNLLNDSNVLAQKCSLFKSQLCETEEKNKEFQKQNEHLLSTIHCLQQSHFKLSEQFKDLSKNKFVEPKTADLKLKAENDSLKKRVNELTSDLAKFICETETLNKITGSNNFSYENKGLGYTSNVKQTLFKNFFVPETRTEKRCFYCKKFGHDISVCPKRKGPPSWRKTNQQGPKKTWVPKSLLYSKTGVPISFKEKTMVLRQWMQQAHDRGQK